MGHVGDGKELLPKARTNHPLCWAAFPVPEGGSLWWAGINRVDWDDTSFIWLYSYCWIVSDLGERISRTGTVDILRIFGL